MRSPSPVCIVGAGLGGLAAATLIARTGANVTLYERASEPGGRARSQVHSGGILNLGPRALYVAGAGAPVLAHLGLKPTGALPPNAGKGLRSGVLHDLPVGPLSFVTSTALTAAEKLALTGLLVTVPADIPIADWLANAPAGAADLARALIRVSSYANAPALMSARAAILQLRRALRGVRYLDGGWQTLVDTLVAGLPANVRRVQADVHSLADLDGTVVLATSPAHARALGVALPDLVPVRAACLDLVLDGLPRPENRFVLGLDRPVYLSEHGAIAKLGGTVVHVARYLDPADAGGDARPELEALMDTAQPGWRDRAKYARFLPELTVSHRVDQPGETIAGEGTADGRTVQLVADWVGEGAMLADRTLVSAAAAADRIIGAGPR